VVSSCNPFETHHSSGECRNVVDGPGSGEKDEVGRLASFPCASLSAFTVEDDIEVGGEVVLLLCDSSDMDTNELDRDRERL